MNAMPLPSSNARPLAINGRLALTPDMEPAALIRHVLDRTGVSMQEAARRRGVTPNAISQYLNRRRTDISLETFGKLLTACGARLVIQLPE